MCEEAVIVKDEGRKVGDKTLQDVHELGVDPEQVVDVERGLAEICLDPEAEARRRRLEARKSRDSGKKWNYKGMNKNPVVNDRFREHDADLEQRRMLAFRGRGRFQCAEDEGDEGAAKEVRKQRAEVAKEFGDVPQYNCGALGPSFFYHAPSREENEAPRKIVARLHMEMGTGIDHRASWWGMVVDAIDNEPGQPGLRLKDIIVEIDSTSLRGLDAEECERCFFDAFCDRCVLTVLPHVRVVGTVRNPKGIDCAMLQSDLKRFGADWDVDSKFEETGSGTTTLRIILEGPQSAMREAKPELEKLMQFYVNDGS